MSCGCKTSGDSGHSCSTKSLTGCESVNTCGNSYKLSVFDWLSGISSPAKPQCQWVEVRFKNDRKCFYKNVNNLPLHIGSVVAVEAAHGHDIGVVSLAGDLVEVQMKRKKFTEDTSQKIYRLATQRDIEIWQAARQKESAIKLTARKITHALQLDMKITDIEYQGDGSKITFYYTSENRVDFRQLIKEYAAAFRAKIDMKQIGFRQEAAKVGGVGSCGRELCCSTWLTDFRSVNTNAARYQQLSINPQKLAGQCGKLKCCLNYELDSYLDALSDFPSSNTTLDTEKGKAFCIKIDVFKKKMWFAYAESPASWYDLDIEDVKKMVAKNKRGEKASPLETLKLTEETAKSVDLIQENNVDRFEKKSRNGGKFANRSKKEKDKSGEKNSQRQGGNRQGSQHSPKIAANPGNPAVGTAPNSEKKKIKKKYPPKKDKNE